MKGPANQYVKGENYPTLELDGSESKCATFAQIGVADTDDVTPLQQSAPFDGTCSWVNGLKQISSTLQSISKAAHNNNPVGELSSRRGQLSSGFGSGVSGGDVIDRTSKGDGGGGGADGGDDAEGATISVSLPSKGYNNSNLGGKVLHFIRNFATERRRGGTTAPGSRSRRRVLSQQQQPPPPSPSLPPPSLSLRQISADSFLAFDRFDASRRQSSSSYWQNLLDLEMYARKAIDTLLNHREVKRSVHSELRQACEEALRTLDGLIGDKLNSSSNNGAAGNAAAVGGPGGVGNNALGNESPGSGRSSISSAVLPEPIPGGSSTGIIGVETYFLPLELACQSKNPKLVCLALDSIEKLVSYGHISYRNRNDVEQSAGESNEAAQAKTEDKAEAKPLFDDHLVSVVANCFSETTDESVQVQVLKALLSIVTSGHVRVHENSLLLAVRTCYNIYLASRNFNYQATAKATLSQIINCVFARMEAASKNLPPAAAINPVSTWSVKSAVPATGEATSMTSTDVPEEPFVDEVEEFVVGTMASSEDVVKSIVLDVIDSSVDAATFRQACSKEINEAMVLQKDCFLVFRSLCKLSMKPLPEGLPPDPKSHELRSKILSLHLLLGILQNGGPAFSSSEVFISAIKTYLCVALSQNGISGIGEVFELSSSMFVELLTKYKRHLRPQIGIFFKEICLNVLESATASFEQKWVVIDGVSRVCNDPQMVVDIYVNYDCDLDSANIFERLVEVLSKMARGRHAPETGSSMLKPMKMKSLDLLVSILRCMVEWSRDLYTNPHAPHPSNIRGFVVNGGGEEMDESLVGEPGIVMAMDSVGPLHSRSNGNSHEDDPSTFEKLKQYKFILEHGMRLFSMKPAKGIRYLQENGIVGPSKEDIAVFLHKESDRIDRTAVGEYLGDLEYREVMYEYVDAMDFSGKDFVVALRHFLEGFRLPGEAQKIDRLMEKFAGRYFGCNPKQDIFASADTAYVLAYSIIILTTDLHSSQVKKKMTKEEFIRNNRGINDSEDLPKEYLSKIYDEIASSEIKMRASSSGTFAAPPPMALTDSKSRQKVWDQESANISKTAEALMESASSKGLGDSAFRRAKHLDHVKPMFKLAWSPVLAAFATGLQDCDDLGTAQLCLEGMQFAIRIACVTGFSLERNAFIQALARFTLLTSNSNVSELKGKNVDTIKTLLAVAFTDGNYLEESWVDVMKCISQLEVAQHIGVGGAGVHGGQHAVGGGIGNGIRDNQGGAKSPQPYQQQMSSSSFMSLPSVVSSVGGVAMGGGLGSSITDYSSSEQAFKDSISATSSQSVLVAVDKIFTGSRNLNGDAIVHFVRALCAVSKDEISTGGGFGNHHHHHHHHPRMFSLNKLVEISYYNMERIRLEWSRIWQVLGSHFNMVGCNESQQISFFAVDSLKQLSLKFLEKGELQNFHFQKDFLRPFEFIMKNNESAQVRDMVVRCIAQMVQSQSKNIRSGWKNIFATFSLAAAMCATDEDEQIVALSFQSVTLVVNDFLADERFYIVDSFQDCVKCLSEFACNPVFPDVAMDSIRLIRKCAKYVSEHKAQFLDCGPESQPAGNATPPPRSSTLPHQSPPDNHRDPAAGDQQPSMDDRVWIRGWFPVLFELSCIINSSKLDIRTRSLTILFDIVKNYGELFESNWWLDLFRVLFRIFDQVRNHDSSRFSSVSVAVNSDLRNSLQQQQQHIPLGPGGSSAQAHHKEWMDTTCNHTLYAMTDVFNEFFSKLSPILLKDLLSLFDWCVRQDNDQLARSAVSCLENLVLTNRPKMDRGTDHIVLDFLCSIVYRTSSPLLTLQSSANSNKKDPPPKQQNHAGANPMMAANSVKSLKHRVLVHLEITSSVRRIIFGVSMKSSDQRGISLASEHCYPDILKLVECLLNSHNVARKCLGSQTVVVSAEDDECGTGIQLDAALIPLMVKQETDSLKCAMEVLLELYHDQTVAVFAETTERRLLEVLSDVLTYFLAITSKSQQDSWTGLLAQVFGQLSELRDDKFKTTIPALYDHICDMLSVPQVSASLRTVLCTIMKRIGVVYKIVKQPDPSLASDPPVSAVQNLPQNGAVKRI